MPIQNRLQDVCPVTPPMSLITLANWIFICVSAVCMR